MAGRVVRCRHCPSLEVYVQTISRCRLNGSEERSDDTAIQDVREQAILEAVAVEDFGKAWRDECADTEIVKRPGSMLAARAVAGILPGERNKPGRAPRSRDSATRRTGMARCRCAWWSSGTAWVCGSVLQLQFLSCQRKSRPSRAGCLLPWRAPAISGNPPGHRSSELRPWCWRDRPPAVNPSGNCPVIRGHDC